MTARVTARIPGWLPWVLATLASAGGSQPAIAQAVVAGGAPGRHANGGQPPPPDLAFTRLTTQHGLSQDGVFAVLQDRRGFMWFATGQGLTRYDGNSFVVYRNDPRVPTTLSHNFIRYVVEDARGRLWAAVYPGINSFDPTTERAVRYIHEPGNPASFSGDSGASITADRHGALWIATLDSGLDRLDPATGRFTNYRTDSDGQFVGWLRRVLEDRNGEIWFVGDRGLFHLNRQTGRITRPAQAAARGTVFDVFEDSAGDFWMLTLTPSVGLVRYNRRTEAVTAFPLGAGATLLDGSRLLDEGEDGFWVPSSLGLAYFDRRTGTFARLYRHDPANPRSLSDNSVMSTYRDRSGLLWVATTYGGVNILDRRQERFRHYAHRPSDPDSLSPGKVTAIHEDREGVLWVGLFPRALDRVDRKTGRVTRFAAGTPGGLSPGAELNAILKDTRGALWLGGWGSGLDRFDERAGRFTHYGHTPGDPQSLMTDNLISVYEDRDGQLWVGQFGGVSRFDPVTERFTNYRPGGNDAASLAYSVSAVHRDRAGRLWFGTWGGILSRLDETTKSFVNYTPKLGDPQGLQGGSIGAIHEDRAGSLWLAAGTGLYQFDPATEIFTRYTEADGLPTADVAGILEDKAGRLWVSGKKGLSRFDAGSRTFRNFDVSDGLRSDDFSRGCSQRGLNGEMLFCGSHGVTVFVPEDIGDNPYVPPVVLTSFRLANRSVTTGPQSVLEQAIPYVDSLQLSYRNNAFSLEFAALSYANSHKNRYRFKLEGFEPDWHEVGSTQRVATYTNLDHGRYVFRVQGSNSDGIWNDAGVSLPIVITPPWYKTTGVRVLAVCLLAALLWVVYQVRMRQLQHAFELTVEARVGERTRIARELHDTLLQSFHGLLLRFQTVSYLMTERPQEAKETLDSAIEQAARAITEGRDAVQGLRASAVEHQGLGVAIRTLGDELASASSHPPAFRVAVEGSARPLRDIHRDEIYRIAAEALRNAFRHAEASRVEVEIRYDADQFRLRVRDDGRGIDRTVLASEGLEGHYGLRGMPERAALIGGELAVWSEAGSGTEVELRVPASVVYTPTARSPWWSRLWPAIRSQKSEGGGT
jgi:signal transduction histidine kinase/ligand-binding sensor domain-containing protein